MSEENIATLQDVIVAGTQLVEGAALVPSSYKLEPTERYQSKPTAFRGEYSTNNIPEFARYVEEMADENSRIFVNPNDLTAIAIFDFGTSDVPQWRENIAELRLYKTPEFVDLLTFAAQSPHSQESVVDYILDWSPSLEFSSTDITDEWEEMTAKNAVQNIRNMTTRKTRDASIETGDDRSAKSILTTQSVESQCPLVMRLKGVFYDGLGEQSCMVRFAYVVDDKPKIRVKMMAPNKVTEHATIAFTGRMKAMIKDVPMYTGNFKIPPRV